MCYGWCSGVALQLLAVDIVIKMSLQTKIIYLFTGCMAALSVVLLYIFVYPHYAVYFPKCMFYTFTGFHCPGCGSQRAFIALLHGDILTAMHNNLLLLFFLPFLFYILFIFLHNLFIANKWQTKVFKTVLSAKQVLIIVLLFLILRNIPVYPFTLLAPL